MQDLNGENSRQTKRSQMLLKKTFAKKIAKKTKEVFFGNKN
jgi:hypothetical protein